MRHALRHRGNKERLGGVAGSYTVGGLDLKTSCPGSVCGHERGNVTSDEVTSRIDRVAGIAGLFRQRPGKCPQCAYSAEGLRLPHACPECGVSIPDWWIRLDSRRYPIVSFYIWAGVVCLLMAMGYWRRGSPFALGYVWTVSMAVVVLSQYVIYARGKQWIGLSPDKVYIGRANGTIHTIASTALGSICVRRIPASIEFRDESRALIQRIYGNFLGDRETLRAFIGGAWALYPNVRVVWRGKEWTPESVRRAWS